MKLIKPKLAAESITDKTEIDNYINSVYEGVTDKNSLKFLPSFILFVACVVEECYSTRSIHKSKINKKQEVFEHMSVFLGYLLSEQDKNIISNIIEDLHSSKRIKKVSMVSKLIFHIGNFFLKKG